MSKILDRLVSQLKDKGYSQDKAVSIAVDTLTKSGSLNPDGTTTAKGEVRGAMSPKQRALDRAVKRSGGKPSDYIYNPITNSTKKRW